MTKAKTKREQFLVDCVDAGLEVAQAGGIVFVIHTRHARTHKVLRGVVLHENGTGFDATVRCDVAKGLRSYDDMRKILGL